MSLDLFKDIERKKEQDLSPKYLLLKDNFQLSGERQIIQSWTEGFIDRDNKIVDEFQKNFHSSFWEFYLHRVLTEYGFSVDMSQETPDFIVTTPIKMNIEAVIPNIKDGGRDESDRTLVETLGGIRPFYMEDDYNNMLDDAILKQYGSIYDKTKKYFDIYSKKPWVDASVPFVLALASFDQVNYGREYHYPLMSILYGLKFDAEKERYIQRDRITKPNGTILPLGIFLNNSHEHISAIMYTCTLTLGKLTSLAISEGLKGYHNLNRVFHIKEDSEWPKYKVMLISDEVKEDLTDGLFIFHNPNAKVKLTRNIFKGSNIVHVYFEDNQVKFESEAPPLVARINSSRLLIDPQLELILSEIDENYNGEKG